jgi:hypothetical protein
MFYKDCLMCQYISHYRKLLEERCSVSASSLHRKSNLKPNNLSTVVKPKPTCPRYRYDGKLLLSGGRESRGVARCCFQPTSIPVAPRLAPGTSAAPAITADHGRMRSATAALYYSEYCLLL